MAEEKAKITAQMFATAAVEQGYCRREQAGECLKAYFKLEEMGVAEDIASVFLKKKALNQDQVQAVERVLKGASQIGNYQILERVGQGGMGAVFRARQLSMDRIVALKILPPKLAANKVFTERFLREARASAKLNHPSIIQGIDVGEAAGYYYFAMEFVDGPTVRGAIEKEGHFPPEKALDIVVQIAQALEHAWKHGMVHRDIKPDNIMLTGKGEAKLCDLGLARMTEEDSSLTVAGQALGTPHYIAPEQARGAEDVDIRADIYSLGASFYHMTIGRTLFTGNSSADIMVKHVIEEASFPVDAMPNVPHNFLLVMARMMAKEREDRYANPAELLQDLNALKAGKRPELAIAFDGKSSIAVPEAARGKAGSTTGPLGTVRGPRSAARTTGPREPVEAQRTPATPPWALVAMGAGAILVVALVVLFAFGRGGDRGSGKTGQQGAVAPPPHDAPASKTTPESAKTADPVASPKPAPPKTDTAEAAAKALAECRLRVSNQPDEHADNLKALESLAKTVAGTPSEAKLKEAIAEERAAWDKETEAEWDRIQKQIQEHLTAKRFVSASHALAGFPGENREQKFVDRAVEGQKALKPRIAGAMKDWIESVRGALGMQDGEAARKALGEVQEQEVPAAYAAEYRDIAGAAAELEKKIASRPDPRAPDALYGKYATGLLAVSAKSNGDIEPVLKAAQESKDKEEHKPIADRIAADAKDLEDCLKLEEEAFARWAAATKGETIDLPKPMPGVAKGRIQEAKGRKLLMTGGTSSSGPTFTFSPKDIPADEILKRSGLDLLSASGAVRAARYLIARGDVAGARKRLDAAKDGGDEVAAMLRKMESLDAAALEAAAPQALAAMESRFKATADAKQMAATLKEYEEKFGATQFAASEDGRKRLASLQDKVGSSDSAVRTLHGKAKRLEGGWYEVSYDFETPDQAADFFLLEMPPGNRMEVTGGVLRVTSPLNPDQQRTPDMSGRGVSVEWKPKVPIESIRMLAFRQRPEDVGRMLGWALLQQPGAGFRNGAVGRFHAKPSGAPVSLDRAADPRPTADVQYGWEPKKTYDVEVSMDDQKRVSFKIDGKERISAQIDYAPKVFVFRSWQIGEVSFDNLRIQFKVDENAVRQMAQPKQQDPAPRRDAPPPAR